MAYHKKFNFPLWNMLHLLYAVLSWITWVFFRDSLWFCWEYVIRLMTLFFKLEWVHFESLNSEKTYTRWPLLKRVVSQTIENANILNNFEEIEHSVDRKSLLPTSMLRLAIIIKFFQTYLLPRYNLKNLENSFISKIYLSF